MISEIRQGYHTELANAIYKYKRIVTSLALLKFEMNTVYEHYPKMNLAGYLIMLTNLQNYHDTYENINNVSIRVAKVGKLADEILSNPSIWEKVSQNGYYRDGNIGKYITRNILEYIYYGEGNPKELGIMLTLHFSENSPLIDSGPFGIFAHEKDLHPDIVEAVENYFNAGKVGR